MEAKKTKKADLEKRKGLFLEIGLVSILAVVLVAFNLRSTDKKDSGLKATAIQAEIQEEIIQTEEEQKPPEPEPEQPEPEVATEVKVIDNDAQSDNELNVVEAFDETKPVEAVPVSAEPEKEEAEEEIFVFVEEEASFPGGVDALYAYLNKNLQYPELARESNISGTVVIKFVVEKDGSITRASILREIGGGCGKEALRVVKGMPKWKPGKQSGRAVRSEFTLPVQFELH